MINILLAEDHNIVRNGIKMLLEADEQIRVVGEAINGIEIMQQVELKPVDMILADINMPEMDGMQLLKEVKAKYPHIKVIMLSMHEHEKYVMEVFKYGGDGYLLKNIGSDELIFAIKFVHQQRKYLCAELTMMLMDKLLKNKTFFAAMPDNEIDFSLRELEIIQLIAEGMTNLEMSEKLFLSKRTIEGHRQSLLDKTGSKNSAALIRYGVLHGLIQ
ncbi:response regulator transcription factor [Pedobacter montanisoli]|uniref:Response regulator transcription factor n=1 Tax=Pedobacter montanisoli TaxID=2923277 RepID=A0ABS9ZZH4_9SPHI|nr:response regulator transcription factor [Pedobacter montanisoli]MCJ0743708.1 response regulator transcription factor [Pedobacter montanisoli]